MKKIFTLLILLLVLAGGWIYYGSKESFPKPGVKDSSLQKEPTVSPNLNTSQTEESGSVTLPDGSKLTIDDFPDEIYVSATDFFGSSDRIKNSVLSPDGKWLAIAIGGAAHDFGWIYNVATKRLTPVIFSYGGGVDIREWKDSRNVIFLKISPKPETREVLINVDNPPQYPL